MPTSPTFKRRLSSDRRIQRIRFVFGVLACALGVGRLDAAGAERLRSEPSAFLRSYAETQVDWMPWGPAAFQRAQKEQKPLYVAIGAFGNELSRAMARQTFSNAATAAMLNSSFVCVLVDRDERPDVAALALAYVRGVKQLEGWPVNLWLTPELNPYEGATYLPPSEEWGKPSFSKIAQQAKDAWTDPKVCRARAADAVAQLMAAVEPAAPAVTAAKIVEDLNTAAGAWMAVADAQHGGFGDAPRNPEPELLRFLLRRAAAEHDAAVNTLRAIANSALRDPLDGGFFRSAADEAWHIPTAQKLLIDQARLADAFLDGAKGQDAAVFAAAARGALDYALSRLQLPDGTFAAAEDGTADEHGDHFAWTEAEIDAVLGAEATAFKHAHGVEAAGNVPADFDPSGHFKGKNILRSALPADAPDLAATAKLRTVRDRRPALPRDERATAAAHGLIMAALARAGTQLNEPRYLAGATRTLAALKEHFGLTPGGELRHLRDANLAATPADDVAVALGCRGLAAAQVAGADAIANALLDRASSEYFSAKAGRYFAVPPALPAGFVIRPLASADIVSSDSLAVLAGTKKPQADRLVSGLDAVVETGSAAAPGDVLLALATAAP